MAQLEQATCRSCGRGFIRVARKSGLRLYCEVCPVGRIKYSTRRSQTNDRNGAKESLALIREGGPAGSSHVWSTMDKIVSLYR